VSDSDHIAERLDVAWQRAMEEPAPWLPPKFLVNDSDPLALKVEKVVAFLEDLDRQMREGPPAHARGDVEEQSFVAFNEAVHRELELDIRVGRGLAMERTENSVLLESLPIPDKWEGAPAVSSGGGPRYQSVCVGVDAGGGSGSYGLTALTVTYRDLTLNEEGDIIEISAWYTISVTAYDYLGHAIQWNVSGLPNYG